MGWLLHQVRVAPTPTGLVSSHLAQTHETWDCIKTVSNLPSSVSIDYQCPILDDGRISFIPLRKPQLIICIAAQTVYLLYASDNNQNFKISRLDSGYLNVVSQVSVLSGKSIPFVVLEVAYLLMQGQHWNLLEL